MRYVVIIVAVFVVTILPLWNSCSPKPPDDILPIPPIPVKIIKQVKVGEVFSISLESNPSTGFDWTVKYDETMIEYLGYSSSPQAEMPKPGDQSYPDYRFKALKSGDTMITLLYQRSKEHGFLQDYVLKTIDVYVIIQDME